MALVNADCYYNYMVMILRPSGGLACHLNWIKLVKNWVMGACLEFASGISLLFLEAGLENWVIVVCLKLVSEFLVTTLSFEILW